jgi:Holliday junction resolvase RusA-like endonuclease
VSRSGERHYRVRDIGLKPTNEKQLAQWTRELKRAAIEAGAPPAPLRGHWQVECTFVFVPPASKSLADPAIGKKLEPDGGLTNTGDIDKLLRAVLDAYTGVFWINDAQVDCSHEEKIYGTESGARIVITTHDEDCQLSFPP